MSDNEVLEKRALMLPQELKAMGPEKEIVIYEGLAHPVLCKKIRYYKDSYFTKRLMPAVEVKPLNLDAAAPRVAKASAVLAASTLALLSACAAPAAPPPAPLPASDFAYDEAANAADEAADRAAAESAAWTGQPFVDIRLP